MRGGGGFRGGRGGSRVIRFNRGIGTFNVLPWSWWNWGAYYPYSYYQWPWSWPYGSLYAYPYAYSAPYAQMTAQQRNSCEALGRAEASGAPAETIASLRAACATLVYG